MKHGSFVSQSPLLVTLVVFNAFASEVYNNPEFQLNLRCALIDFLRKIRTPACYEPRKPAVPSVFRR